MGREFSTWSCDPSLSLVGCGIDAEEIARFERYAEPGSLLHFPVFSDREVVHARGLSRPAKALCAAFCCKEALFKALGRPYDYEACELLLSEGRSEQDLWLSPRLRREHALDAVLARLAWDPPGHCVATVLAFTPAPPTGRKTAGP